MKTAAKINKYGIHDTKYGEKKFLSKTIKISSHDYVEMLLKSFAEARKLLFNSIEGEKQIEIEIVFEILLSFECITASLLSRKSLINLLPIVRLFFDNIARYYYFNLNKESKVDITNFDKKKAIEFTKVLKYKKIFPSDLMAEYHMSGAENHFGSIFNRNMTGEDMDERDKFILNSLKAVFMGILPIFADIVIKLAKQTDKDMLMLFYSIEKIITLASFEIIKIEGRYF